MYETEINNFIDLFKSSHQVTVLSVVVFGSALYKNEDQIEDIDIFIVLAEDKVFRGNYYFENGRRIDYFTGSSSLIEAQLNSSKNTTETLPIFVFGEGKILFGAEHSSHLVELAKNYLNNFTEYDNKETLLKATWYSLTDAYDDYIKTNDLVAKNLALAIIINSSMEFYCIYHNELMKKGGTSDRGEFYNLHSALHSNEDKDTAAKNLLNFLSQQTGYEINKDWEVQYR